MFFLTMIVITICLSIFVSSWWLIVVAIVLFYKYVHYMYHNGRPWRKLHYPIMLEYAKFGGAELQISNALKRDFNIILAIKNAIQSVKPSWSDEKILSAIESSFDRCDSFSDKSMIESHLRKHNPTFDQERMNEKLLLLKSSFTTEDRAMAIRFAIAEIVEKDYGKEARDEYIIEILKGNAN